MSEPRKTVVLRLVVSEANPEDTTKCEDCGFDSVLRFPVHALSDEGVTSFGHFKACGRCYYEDES